MYFYATEEYTRFPDKFVFSCYSKAVMVLNCRLIYGDNYDMVGDVLLHSDLVQRDDELDGFICFSNTIMPIPKVYEITGNQNIYHFWFTDMDGNIIVPRRFLIEMLLEY